MGILYYFGLITAYIFLFKVLFLRTKIYYEDEKKENKRIKGKAILICNHQSPVPVETLALAYKYFFRRIYFIIADFFKERKRFFKTVIRAVGGVFVDREAYSFDFFEKSKRLLNKNKLVLIFPEGRVGQGYEPINFVYSYVMLAVQSGAKIVPVASDCRYGLFKKNRVMIGKSIDLSHIPQEELTKEKLKEINEDIYQRFLRLYYLLKKRTYQNFSNRYEFIAPKAGDMIRINAGTHHHYGVYLSAEEVVQFGRAVNPLSEKVIVNSVSLKEFCGGSIPEVRVLKSGEARRKKAVGDSIAYARQCLGRGGYNIVENNCFDFANRIVFD
ncbi:MAG: 1-acyl-sn-glycerol-3-phosphate acyltransferase [Firmicutes bacterium]|nr:1-acyl-sn-glycerol-3-phosphate acyltransferase [Bacillota bacterium]